MRAIPRVLALVREQRARVVMLIPDWKMHWFAAVVSAAQETIYFEGDEPFFRRRRDEQWQSVHRFLFRPMLVVIDASVGGVAGGAAKATRARV